MARQRYKPEEIVAKLRQVDVLVSQGQNMVDAIRQIGVSEVTYYRKSMISSCMASRWHSKNADTPGSRTLRQARNEVLQAALAAERVKTARLRCDIIPFTRQPSHGGPHACHYRTAGIDSRAWRRGRSRRARRRGSVF